MSIQETLDEILEEGAVELKKEGLDKHVEALSDALFKVMIEPECEVRLTYKTTAQAMAAWTWMIWAAKRMDLYDVDKSFAFGIELTNGSGLRFFTEENSTPKEAVPSG